MLRASIMRTKVRRSIELAAFLILMASLHFYQTRTHSRGMAPTIKAQVVTEENISSAFGGNDPFVVHFWATWCGVCRAEEGNVNALAQRARVVTVASRSGSAESVRRYMKAHGLAFDVVMDPDGAIAAKYGVRAYPTSFFVSPKGEIRTSEVGYTTYLGFLARLWVAGW